ncbi:hypothetical protein AVEN_256640-1 [Araneus ventricosus]|uniref:Uncharacterized protein n=1 Tax=Araneus ventricosus TaxID=182803 RepID=A0A4Y2NDJ3_ARAVE|nr:hypothetical protein AVEN_256640-1 [Araneus ventricosus]
MVSAKREPKNLKRRNKSLKRKGAVAELEEKKRIQELEEKNLELERLNLETQAKLNLGTAEHTRSTGNDIKKLLHKFKSKEDISLYLMFFERQTSRIAITKEFWVPHLLVLLPLEITHIVAL